MKEDDSSRRQGRKKESKKSRKSSKKKYLVPLITAVTLRATTEEVMGKCKCEAVEGPNIY